MMFFPSNRDREPVFGRRDFLVLGAALCLPSCGGTRGAADAAFAWGEPGLRDGQFQSPRAIGVFNGEVYVIDKSGRIQVFGLDGAFRRKWRTPAYENGAPTAVALANDGNVVVPDTHYSQILKYTPAGELLERWGTYGTGPGQFVYPTDVVQTPEGAYFISEYGMDAERVQAFDAEKRFVRQWGGLGEGRGQFNRAMAIDRDAQGVLYVADTANHRIQCFDPDGRLLRIIGEAGAGRGRLKFPCQIAVAGDGSVVVCEYGNHRVSQFLCTGEFVACLGGPGRRVGEFNGPRGVAVSPDGRLYVADTDNHRVQCTALKELS